VNTSVVTAFEHGTLRVGEPTEASLTVTEAERLFAISASKPGFCAPGHRSVRFAQHAGLVNMGGRVLEVLPKAGEHLDVGRSRGTFLRLLHLADGLPPFSQGVVGHSVQRQTLLGVFVSAYVDALMQLMRTGLLRRYRSDVDDLRVLRGRLLITRQAATHGMRPDVLACRYDELTIDNPWNQVLRAALHLSRPWLDGTAHQRRWLELGAAFDEVALRRDAVDLLQSLVPDRQVHYYATAMRWAALILKLLSPNIRAGRSEAPELLFDMNRLFEAAVARQLTRDCAGRGQRVCVQDSELHLAHLDGVVEIPIFRLRPDLVVRDQAQVVAVADTKWTRIQVDGRGRLIPEESHVYQMNAYASVYPCSDFYLVYPWHEGLAGASNASFAMRGFRNTPARLHVVCVDVGDDGLPARSGSWRL